MHNPPAIIERFDSESTRATATLEYSSYDLGRTTSDDRVTVPFVPRYGNEDKTRTISDRDVQAQFRQSVYVLAAQRKPRHAINLLFTQLDFWLRSGEFAKVDALFKNLDASALQSEVVLAPLAITLAAKPKLDAATRSEYCDRAENRITFLTSASYARELLSRFK